MTKVLSQTRCIRKLSVAAVVSVCCCASGACHQHTESLDFVAKNGAQFDKVSAAGVFAPGYIMRRLDGESLIHKPLAINLDHRKHGTVLFVLSPDCPYCRINLHNWRDLLALNSKANIVWVDLTGRMTEQDAYADGIPAGAHLILLSQTTSQSIGFTGTPTTLYVDSAGRVKWSWDGVLNAQQLASLKSLLIHNSDPTVDR